MSVIEAVKLLSEAGLEDLRAITGDLGEKIVERLNELAVLDDQVEMHGKELTRLKKAVGERRAQQSRVAQHLAKAAEQARVDYADKLMREKVEVEKAHTRDLVKMRKELDRSMELARAAHNTKEEMLKMELREKQALLSGVKSELADIKRRL